MAQPAVLSLGSINADLRFEVDKPFSSDATVRASGFSRKSGGKAANVAYFTQRLGFPTKLLGQVGDDDLATVAIGPFMQENLDLEAVFVAPNSMTGIAVVVVPADGNKSILSVANANMNWQTPAVEKVVQAIDNAPASSVLIADFEVPRIVLEAAFKAAERRGFRIIVDPTFADQIEKTDLKRFYAVSPNQKEAADVLGIKVANESQASQAATEFNALGVEIACVKLSDGGCILGERNETTAIRAPAVDVVDKTGAGDAFIAAFAAATLEDKSAYEAACWGVAASTFSVGRKGTQASYPKRSQFDQMLASVLKKNGR
ncbi:PfkB family carbohydrate kinase [Mesorhizobium sp. M0830]|uniref:PfkB family carbohydrate kinase n=1 Tax=Mesorhizobium sp. M0830 TaxID=2957008 RepID=UPI00333559D2